ncbi:MAG TPA: HlyD family efflux transporter periplasmic adaptor subunit [Novosphingobium sp.]|nr:HlyD family efflux transporter periplasmic adaptor subunit [Novosphingobium sp.]
MSDSEHHSPLDALLGATPKRARRHLVSLALLAVAAAVAVVLLVRFLAGNQSPYYFAPVEVGDITPLVSERGLIRASSEIVIKAPFEATVTSVPGAARGRVKSGQVLAQLDAASTKEDLTLGQAELATAEAALSAAKVTVQETTSRLARFESVWRRSGQRVPSLNELEGARADAQRARQQEAAALARVNAVRLRVRHENRRLKSAFVRSPIDGYVVSRLVQPGRRVQAGLPMFTLAAGLDRLTIAVPLTKAQASELRPGASATVRVDDVPDQVRNATLARLAGAEGGQTGIFVLQNPVGVVPGMQATLEIELPPRRGVLLVPNSALEFAPSGSAGRERDGIYLLGDDGEPRHVYVSAGASDGRRTEIFGKGVEPGAQVITGWRNPPVGGGSPGQ